MIKNFFNNRQVFWLILSIPAIPLLIGLANGGMSPHVALHPTGETATRLMIITMMISPLRVIFPHARWLYWLLRRRRPLGVAAFFYAALHTVLYLVDKGTFATILAELPQTGIWTGWLAMLIFVPLAITSNDASVRYLGQMWKPLQRWVYPAAVLTVLHWAFVSDGIGGVVVHFLPLALLEAWRIYKTWQPGRAALT